MQLTRCEVIPVELKVSQVMRMAGQAPIQAVTAVFVRLETRQGQSAWGCTVADPSWPAEASATLLHACQACAVKAPDLHPTDLEYTLSELTPVAQAAAAEPPNPPTLKLLNAEPPPPHAISDAALCAFDLAYYDLLGLAAGMPLYRLLGGYRNRIQTSITILLAPIEEAVETARKRAREGFRILKVKGGEDPETDVRRIRAIHRALPDLLLRLDADGGYTVQQALDVARALPPGAIEFLEQPTPAGDLAALAEVTRHSPAPVLADQSACGADSALQIAAGRCAHGLSVKLAACGGLRNARQVDAIARAARLSTMVGCLVEPALLIAAGLSLALSSPNVRYGDLDGHLYLRDDPSVPGFTLQDGWLIASDVPGLGYSVNLG
jgi:L-alanine-DL-glutamate epimerase-like enolase superfamily enzyme